MSVKNCKACDHFCDSGQAIGTCRRFPLFQTRSPNEWCGEFTPVPYAEAVPEMLALPVREMTQTLGEMLGYPNVSLKDAQKALEEAIEQSDYEHLKKPKRKYTRKADK